MTDANAQEIEDEGPLVCHRCIGDARLKAEIKRQGQVAICDYCQHENLRCVGIDWLAERVDPIFRAIVGPGEEEPIIAHDNVHWGISGQSPSEVLTEMMDAADAEISQAVIAKLASDHNWDVFEGGLDVYDETSEIYSINLPQDPTYRDAWDTFCQSLKHKRRFFSADAKRLLDDLVGPLLRGGRSQFGKAVRTIGPNTDDRFVYRARLANDESARRAIYAEPLKQLGAPPPHLAGAGRMNPAGISVFYGSFDPTTCIAELRAPVGGQVVVGRFEIIRPLRVLDLTRLESLQNSLSYFHPDFLEAHRYGEFIAGFHGEIRKPVIPGAEALEYLPTQVVAEYLWTRTRRIDGVIFGSAQVSGQHANVVLFSHACIVEGAPQEQRRTITHVGRWADDEDNDRTEHVWHEPEPVAAPSPEEEFDDDVFFAVPIDPLPQPVEPEPALRFVHDGGLQVHTVHGIQYATTPATVEFIEEQPRGEGLPVIAI